MANARNPSSLTVNCGFARVAIHQITNELSGNRGRAGVHSGARGTKFQSLFQGCDHYGIPEGYFDHKGPNSQFDRHCTSVLNTFNKKWHPLQAKSYYLSTFTRSKWEALSDSQKTKHTLGKCEGCHQMYLKVQEMYPAKPVYNPSVVTIEPDVILKMGPKKFTEQCTKDLDVACQQATGKTFVEQLVSTPKLGIQRKKTPYQIKKAKRTALKSIRNHLNMQLADKATISLLAENESISKYSRKRRAQAFETPTENEPSSKKKKHSPTFETVTWDKEKVIVDANNWPVGEKINWSQFGRDHNVGGRNAGQVVKEFCKENGIDVNVLKGNTTPCRRFRAKKKRLPGGEVSSPALPPPRTITAEIQQLSEGGHFLLGEACVPYTLRKYKAEAGVIQMYEVQVQGRKIALTDVREKLLLRQEKYMRLLPDTKINVLTHEEAHSILKRMRCKVEDATDLSKLKETIAKYQRCRTLALWHDHGTLLGIGLILVTLHVVYDTAVFLTSQEYEENIGGPHIDIQTQVEQPEIHMIAMGSSSIEDQVALISDRVECILELKKVTTTAEGIDIHDKLKLFTGDHPAAQFERGTQMGGTYKCGSCGCKDSLMDDQAYALQCPRRSLAELQSVATAGVFGKQPFQTKPFGKLKVTQLRQELERRGLETDALKPVLLQTLQETLKGIQRVPSLLLSNPTQPLSNLNLEDYTVLDSEPLHDLKGHLHNILAELPHNLPADQQAKTEDLLKATLSKDKITGADLRKTVIHLYLLLSSCGTSPSVLMLLQTAVTIGQILYSREEVRTPRQILQLYNSCWIHHELCRELFSAPTKVTRTTMFGTYLHSLTAHSPQQYEFVCQKSINTENQERLFGQARAIATATTNRKPENVIPNVLLRLQAKKELSQLYQSVAKAESQVRSAAKNLPPVCHTYVSKRFLAQRTSSWQAHLNRISPYLVPGRGVWWEEDTDGYIFHDGDNDPNYRGEGPDVLHIRSSTIQAVLQRQKECWETILLQSTELPAQIIRLYNSDGESTGMLTFGSSSPTRLHLDPPRPMNPESPPILPTSIDSQTTCTDASYAPRSPTSWESILPSPPSTDSTLLPSTSTETSLRSPMSLETTNSTESLHPPMSLDSTLPPATSTRTSLHPPMNLDSILLPATSTGTSLHPPICINLDSTLPPATSTGTSLRPPMSFETTLCPQSSPDATLPPSITDTDETHIIVPGYGQQSTSVLKSSYAKAIAKVLGECPNEVKLLDTTRVRIKHLTQGKKKPPKSLVEEHHRLLAVLQQRILTRRAHVRKEIENWEKSFYAHHKRLPTLSEDTEYHHLIKTREHICKFISTWQITI